MARRIKVKEEKNKNQRIEATKINDKQIRSFVSFGLFPLSYAVGFIPEMAYFKQMMLFAITMIVGNIGLMRTFYGRNLIVGTAGLFILGSILNIIFIGVSQIVILLVLGVVFAFKMKKVLEELK